MPDGEASSHDPVQSLATLYERFAPKAGETDAAATYRAEALKDLREQHRTRFKNRRRLAYASFAGLALIGIAVVVGALTDGLGSSPLCPVRETLAESLVDVLPEISENLDEGAQALAAATEGLREATGPEATRVANELAATASRLTELADGFETRADRIERIDCFDVVTTLKEATTLLGFLTTLLTSIVISYFAASAIRPSS